MTNLERAAAIAGVGSLLFAGLAYFQRDPIPVKVITDAPAPAPESVLASPPPVINHPQPPVSRPRGDDVATPPPSVAPVAPKPALVPPEAVAPADQLVDVVFQPGDRSPGLRYVTLGLGDRRLGPVQYEPAAPLRVRLPRGNLPIRFQIVGQQTQPFMTFSDSYGTGVIVEGPAVFVVDAFDDGTGRYGINIKRDTDPR